MEAVQIFYGELWFLVLSRLRALHHTLSLRSLSPHTDIEPYLNMGFFCQRAH